MFLAGAAHAQSALMITGVMDGTLGSGHPKVVELYARQDISDLSVYQLGLAFDGQPLQEPAYRFPAVSLKKGSFVYLSSQQAGFYSFFGWQAGLVAGFLQINGNDALALYRHGELMDVYGQPGQNGTGTAWEYTDGWAYRKRA
ncbi:MAG: nuclease, partial [Bacteroidetes bacterium]